MATAGIDSSLAQNIQALQRQGLKVEFHLDHTDYKKVENIGTGAYGVVCSAVNRKTRQKVAIKKIPNIFTMDPRYAIRTYREIKILQHFKHENVIAIREILQPPNKDITDVYVVMDLMESDLHKIVHSKQTLTDEHVRYFLYQILRGLKYVHSAHVIHRDLKPSNLLVNADCELKIGDFGMARGINFKAEKSNQQMTQYVATRWYRAPELIVAASHGYGAAIDMWSVGCIFAEMLRRRHLFPGRDLVNQMAIIFGTLGVPSPEYLKSLDSKTVCDFIRKISKTNEVKKKSWAELCPSATAESLDLLAKMLVIEPEKRITVETALAHPFLSKYHDTSYEPSCAKKFDFAFEQELVNLQTDEQRRVKIQELLRREVLSYRKPTVMDFSILNSKLTKSTSETTGSTSTDDPYADLNAFLAKLTSPTSEEKAVLGEQNQGTQNNPLLPKAGQTNKLLQANQTTNPLLANQQTGNSLLANQQTRNSLLTGQQHGNSLLANQLAGNSLLANQQTGNPLLANQRIGNSLLSGQSKTNSLLSTQAPANPILANQPKANPLLEYQTKPNTLLANQQDVNPLLAKPTDNNQNSLCKKQASNSLLASNAQPVVTSTSHCQVTDRLADNSTKATTETKPSQFNSLLTSNQIFNESQDSTKKDEVSFSSFSTTGPTFQLPKDSERLLTHSTSESDQSNDMDMFNAMMKSFNSDANTSDLTVETVGKANDNDIEMLSAKLVQADISKGTKAAENSGLAVDTRLKASTEDIEMLSAKLEQTEITEAKEQAELKIVEASDAKALLRQRIIKAQFDKQSKGNLKSVQDKPAKQKVTAYQRHQERKEQKKQRELKAKQKKKKNKEQESTGQLLTTEDQKMLERWKKMAKPQPIQPKPQMTIASSSTVVTMTTTASKNVIVVYPALSQTAQSSIATINTNIGNHPISITQPIYNQQPAASTQYVTQQPSVAAVAAEYARNPMIGASTSRQPIRTFSDIAALHSVNPESPLTAGEEESLYDLTHIDATDQLFGSSQSQAAVTDRAPTQTDLLPDWSNDVSVNTTLDISSIIKSKPDGGMQMSIGTPKGTGGGYGVGYDLEQMMPYNAEMHSESIDADPLSASLIADWMDVTGNMDLDAIHNELSSALDNFPFE